MSAIIENRVCPDFLDHTLAPEGYLAWHDWAKRMSKTHRSIKCAGCGLYKIWIPKRSTPLHPEGE